MRNLITDVAGLTVGHAHDTALGSGVTAILFDTPAVAGVDVRGGGPGTRDTELLQPERTVDAVDAIVLSGGSAFGLDSPSGVQAYMREQGRGFRIGPATVPIVPSPQSNMTTPLSWEVIWTGRGSGRSGLENMRSR